MTIIKSDYLEKRYILQTSLYLKKDKIDEIYDGMIKNNVLFFNVKDILFFTLTSNNTNHTNHHDPRSDQHRKRRLYKCRTIV